MVQGHWSRKRQTGMVGSKEKLAEAGKEGWSVQWSFQGKKWILVIKMQNLRESPFAFYLFTVYMCSCVCMYASMHLHLCKGQRLTLSVFLNHPLSPTESGRSAILRSPPESASPNRGYRCIPLCWLFMWVMGTRTQIHTLT